MSLTVTRLLVDPGFSRVFLAGPTGPASVLTLSLLLSSTDMEVLCQTCRKFKPNRSWDRHPDCPLCRSCSKEANCDICSQWKDSQWEAVTNFLQGKRKKVSGQTLQSSVASATQESSGHIEGVRTLLAKGPIECETSLSAQATSPDSGVSGIKGHAKKQHKASKPSKPSKSSSAAKGKTPKKGGPKVKSSDPNPAQGPSTSSSRSLASASPIQPPPTTAVAAEQVQPHPSEPSNPFEEEPISDPREFEGFTPEELLELPGPHQTVRPSARSLSRSGADRSRRSPSRDPNRTDTSPRGTKRPNPSEELLNRLLSRLSQVLDKAQSSQLSQPGTTQDSGVLDGPQGSQPPPSQSVTFQDSSTPRIRSQPSSPGQEASSAQELSFSDSDINAPGEAQTPSASGSQPTALRSEITPPVREIVETSDSEDEEPLLGTMITTEAFQNAVEVVRRVLGFDPPEEERPPPTKRSRLTLNKPKSSPAATLPVDIECSERFQELAKRRKWSAYPARAANAFRVDESEWKELFCSPSIPSAAKDKLTSCGVMDSKGKFTSKDLRAFESELQKLDSAARMGLKFSSALLLLAEVIMLAFQQNEDRVISRKDTGSLVNLLGPTSRLVFDQLARISVRATARRRDIVLDSLTWPSEAIKSKFKDIPLSGQDLFNGEFESLLQAEVKRHKDMRDSDFRPRKRRQFPASSRQSRPYSSSNASSSSVRRDQRRQPRRSQAFQGRRTSRQPLSRPPRQQNWPRGSRGPQTSRPRFEPRP